MAARLHRLLPVARTICWPALAVAGLVCAAVVVLAPLAPASSPLTHWPGLGALALCVGAAFLLDDESAAATDATPTSLARRRLARLAIGLPLPLAVWTAAVWHATAADGAWFGPDARAVLTLQLAALLALTLAGSAVALRVMREEHGGWAGAFVPFTVLGTAFLLPDRWALLTMPDTGQWQASQLRWALLLVLALLTLAWASRDHAAR